MPTIIIAVLGMIFFGVYILKLIQLHKTLEKKEDRILSFGFILLMGFFEIVMLAITVRTIILTSKRINDVYKMILQLEKSLRIMQKKSSCILHGFVLN